MFGDVDRFEREIELLLAEFDFDEILEMIEVSREECLSILLNGGHGKLPPFLEKDEDDYVR